MGQWDRARQEVHQGVLAAVGKGLLSGASGNLSLLLAKETLAITPTRVPYSRLTWRDIVVVDFKGRPLEGEGSPSSETMTHVAVYRARPDVRAILHAHAPYTGVCAVAGLSIPPIIDELVISVGGAVAVAQYGFPGSPELGRNVCHALEERKAVLMRNHGLLAVGATLEEALLVAELVENTARIYVFASLLGKPNLLPPEVAEAEQKLYRMTLKATQE